MGKRIDLTGKRFSRLVAIEDCGKQNGHRLWQQSRSRDTRFAQRRHEVVRVPLPSDLLNTESNTWTLEDTRISCLVLDDGPLLPGNEPCLSILRGKGNTYMRKVEGL
jgi:hypothetical protein